jgi:hypothetical protein
MGCVFFIIKKKTTAGGGLPLFVGDILVRESPPHNIGQKMFDLRLRCVLAVYGCRGKSQVQRPSTTAFVMAQSCCCPKIMLTVSFRPGLRFTIKYVDVKAVLTYGLEAFFPFFPKFVRFFIVEPLVPANLAVTSPLFPSLNEVIRLELT